jgi:hypothetical protein
MKRWKRCAHFSVAAFLGFLLCARAISQEKAPPSNSSKPDAIKPPEHPITEEQLRSFFKVMHFDSVNRPLIHEKLELQRKRLPEWYPQSVWNEIEDSIENMDWPAVALPVSQKYLSEDDAKFLTWFMATPQGQKLVHTLLTNEARAQYAGAPAEKAHEQAMAELARNENAEVERVLSGMTPEELREIDSQSAHWEQMQPALRQLREEVGQALIAQQKVLARTIAAKHRSELLEAKRSYEASHPSAQSSNTPQ